ncbi:hypothetical protein [Cupriavidus pinatubonensis]|uniref:hypothetical protein n=1 Tax=Cupriavidus pinatubonensis TaxID=248026 RepID=UPI001127514A|nr:hypothetical protein [Cupriavidus pinatubonensis]TPQ32688.1 hypothetical protein C2U69_26395 [Cupriavidus pinatubonensis]
MIQRGSNGFDVADFPSEQDCTQLFLTWELPIEDANVGQGLKVVFDNDRSTAMRVNEEQVWLNGERVSVHHESGQWRRAD